MKATSRKSHLNSRSHLGDVYNQVRSRTEALCAPLKTEDYIPQPDAFASPPKWHLAHTTWFFEELILKTKLKGYQPFNESFSFLFNSYYNSIGDRSQRDHRGAITRPTVTEVYAYRSYVDNAMLELINLEQDTNTQDLIILGLQHEQQHQELLLTDLKHTFFYNPTYPVYKDDFDLVNVNNKSEGWVTVNEGIYTIGHQDDGFCFDNELGVHKVYLRQFSIAKALVTNGAYLEFIKQGGYQEFKYWLDEGWAWVSEEKIKSPLYWEHIDGQWFEYTLAGLKPLQLESILSHISFYEAQAFATFKGMRLPTEFEWEAASQHLDWGQRWEWTYSAYLPYPGFKTAKGAVGEYNGKFMVNQMVLRGKSLATALNHSRHTYRNFFHPHYRWQYTGIRLIK